MSGLLATLCIGLWAPPAPDGAAVERLLDAHGWGALARDATLDVAARRLAQELAGPPDQPPPDDAGERLRTVLHALRVTDVQVFPFTVRHATAAGFADRLPRLLARLDRRTPPTHYGLATCDAHTTTLLLVHRGVTLDAPLPQTAAPGDIVPIRGALRRGYFRPRVVVASPGGERSRDRPAWGEARRVEVSVYLDDGPGVYGVEIIADSQYGPVVLHNHTIGVGLDAPPLPVVKAVAPPAWDDPVRGLVVLINAERARRNAAPLQWHDPLAEVAAEHARELAARRSLSHASPNTGTLATRLRARGVAFDRVAENLALARDATEALQAFLGSPGHARNLLDPRLTHVGVGVEGRYFAVAFARLAE